MPRSREWCFSLTRDEIFQELSGVFEEVLGRPVALREETTGADVDGWDSVAHLMLILASERTFDVRFEGAEIANAANVGQFVSLIEAKRGWDSNGRSQS
jgi:acyl carrier protein